MAAARTWLSRVRHARFAQFLICARLRPVVLWLPDVNDPAYQARLPEECRRLAELTPEEDAPAADFAELAAREDAWC